MKRFMALLKRNDCEDSPQTKLLDEAGRLFRNLRHSSCTLEKLVKAMEQGRHWGFLLTNIHVVRASVLVHIHSSQYDVACKLLENCKAIEKEELVRLWNEIHYHKAMKKWHKQSLTAVQKFRCRKSNPPPASLCPEGVKNRNYPKEVRQMLQRFAVEITTKPSRQQREGLARSTNLQPQHIYNWFANYRRRQKTRPSQPKEPVHSSGIKDTARQEKYPAERTGGQKGPAQNTSQPSFCFQDGLHEGSGFGQTEMSLVTRNPGWEQVDRGQVCSPCSILQSRHLEGFGSSPEFMNPIRTKEFAAFYSQAEEQHGRHLGTSTVESRWEPSGTPTSLWTENPSFSSCALHPTQQWAERLPVSRTASEASKTDPYTLWRMDTSCVRSACCKKSPSVCIEARAETVRDQAENEGLMLSERQLGSLEAPLPHSSTPRCPVVSMPYPGGSQMGEHEQEKYLRQKRYFLWQLSKAAAAQARSHPATMGLQLMLTQGRLRLSLRKSLVFHLHLNIIAGNETS